VSFDPMQVPTAERTVPSMLARGASLWPDKTALETHSATLTYAQLAQRSYEVAGGLAALGITRGGAVAIMLPNCVEHVLTWFGASCLGAAEVPINTALPPEQVGYIIEHSEAEVIVLESQYIEHLSAAASELSRLRVVVVVGDMPEPGKLEFEVKAFAELSAHPAVEPSHVGPGDVLGVMYTSGTTGHPKGVLVSQAQTYGRMLPGGPGAPGSEDRTLVVLPIYHVIGQCRALYNTLIVGGTAVLEPRFSASRFWDICRTTRATFVPLVGAMVSYLLNQPVREEERDHVVRHIALGTTSPDLEEFQRRFDIPEISMSYGLTEAGGVLVGPAEPAGCGFVRSDFEARLVDELGLGVPPGETGELVLRGRDPWSTMIGYFKDAEATVAKTGNLWLHTGDLMWQREDGMFMFAGRRSDRIRVRGENVSPGDVENAIRKVVDIVDVAVVGVDSTAPGAAVGDQEVLAAIVPQAGTTIDPERLIEALTRHLPKYALPRFVSLHDALPKTDATQRVQRNVLAKQDLSAVWDRQAITSAN
jgi:crotonobetaine/carnitine-CoA ligase